MKPKTKKGCKSTRKRKRTKTRRNQRGGGKQIFNPTGNLIGEYEGDTHTNGQPHGSGMMRYTNGDVCNGEFKEGVLDGFGKCEFVNRDVYVGVFKNDYMTNGTMRYIDGTIYEGEFGENSQRSGRGIMRYTDGTIYEGAWLNDKRNGIGKVTFSNGIVYECTWLNDQMHGRGIMRHTDGTIYEGDFDDYQQTNGKMTYTNGIVYEGDWLDGLRSGKGKMTYTNGAVYHGNWLAGNANGQGTMTYTNGDVYDGNWLAGNANGQGTKTYTNGDVYSGSFVNGHMTNGKMMYAAYENMDEEMVQDIYEGEWKDNAMEGTGKMIYANGNIYEGEWIASNRTGQGKMTYANRDVYQGGWLADNKHGEGTMIYANGNIYEGEWWNDNMQGDGKMRYANGDIYEGNWWSDEMHGDGKMTYAADGRVYEGLWRNNRENPLFNLDTCALADNPEYNPTPPRSFPNIPNNDNMLYANENYEYFNMIENTHNTNLLADLNPQQPEQSPLFVLKFNQDYYALSIDSIIRFIKNKNYIKYECTRFDTEDQNPRFSMDVDVNKSVPYFSLNGIVGGDGVVLLDDLCAAIKSGHRAFRLVIRRNKLLSTVSHHILYNYGTRVGSSHCQTRKIGEDVYDLHKLLIVPHPIERSPRAHQPSRARSQSPSRGRSPRARSRSRSGSGSNPHKP